MGHRGAWIVSNDPELVAELRQHLQQQQQGELICFPHWQSIQNGQAAASADWLFFDLRCPQSWQDLADFVPTGQRVAQPIPWVGIVQHGIPPARAVLADQALNGTVLWPSSGEGLSEKLKENSVSNRSNLKRQREPKFRELKGDKYSFRSHVPELFPLIDDLAIAAPDDDTILLVGETGTGKTTIARLIHEVTSRGGRPFVNLSCGTLPNELIDSELFGHVKGAFTGADQTTLGRLESARDGTILLDEIDVLGASHQAKLLRVIETGEFEPIGSNDTHSVRARMIVATNFSLESLIEDRKFRSDLYFRLNQLKFEIPPLRRRVPDIVHLAVEFVSECCAQKGVEVQYIHPEFLTALKSYSWPGNVRELRNEIRRAVLFCRDNVLEPTSLSPVIRRLGGPADGPEGGANATGLAGEVAQTEQRMIEQMLKSQNFNRAATARALGISRVTLYNKIRKYNIRMNAGKRQRA